MKEQRVALITGGTRGIGLGIAHALAAEGLDLALNGMRDAEQVQETLEELRNRGSEVIYCQGDVGSGPDRTAIIEAVREKFGRLDVLVNNAGITSPGRKDLMDAEEADFDRVIAVNLKGPYFLTQLAARLMSRQSPESASPRRCIVNVSSVSAEVVSTNRGDYCLSKAAAEMSTHLWAVRLAEFEIDVFEIRPGIISSDMTAAVREKYNRLLAEGLTLERRWGQPEDIGKAVAMLVRGDLPYATGQTLKLDGGMTIQTL